jgi:D-alanyl-lipoteichoic acid acyltransferase DltB (MBOAT superfamily)
MSLTHILAFVLASIFIGWVLPKRWRGWGMLIGSVLAIFWMQPSTPVRNLDFWFPIASIALTVFVWGVTQSRQAGGNRLNLFASLVIVGSVLAVALTRYTGPACCLTPTRPPDMLQVVLLLGVVALAASIPYYLFPNNRFLPTATILFILVLFILIKTEPLARSTSAFLRTTTGQSVELASMIDLPWLGFSFLAFRLLHVLRDHQTGILPGYSLGEFVTYAIFFPAYTAGPIDRSQRFMGDLRKNTTIGLLVAEGQMDRAYLFHGGERIIIGLFKKFVIADSLALFALNSQNATQVNSTTWMWVVLYAYSLRIYFDFAGYTDIAIGMGQLMGIRLPENFNRPYLKQNITQFWNSWHITLAQWFRAYFFNPFMRALRANPKKFPTWMIILIGQLCTMLLIGLWHGITWNFAIWGAWHGLGLFTHNRWSNWIRPHFNNKEIRPGYSRLLQFGGWLITFNFVTLGWVWFALPSVSSALSVFQKLFGF